jgi:glycosyltransferase involved in cell wall biosynthesis
VAVKIVHVWDAYAPSLFDQVHPYLLNHPEHSSMVLAAHLIENQAALLPHTFYLDTRTVEEDIVPSMWVRGRRRIRREFAEALRQIARRSRANSIWADAPLALSQFNRFCLRHASAFGPDLIHAHFGTTGVMALPFIRAIGAPAVVTFYGVDVSASLQIARWRDNFREMFGRMSRVIVLCDAARDRLTAIGCPPEKIAIWNLPAGVERYPYRPRRPVDGLTRFLIAARFVEKKGHAYLIDAFDRVVRRGLNARLTMIGYGPFRKEVEHRIASRGLADRVSIIDTELAPNFVDLYGRELAESDIFVLPSTTGSTGDDEGGPALTMVCAQAAGLPVISTPFAGSERSVIDGVTGLFCRQDDAESLAEKMWWLAEHRDRWNVIGAAGSRHVLEHFSLDGQIRELLDLYHHVIAGQDGCRHRR